MNETDYNELVSINYKKYEIKNIINCLKLKPFVIEFTGTPRTGKTTIINKVEDFFRKGGYKVKVIEEFTTSKFYKEKIKKLLEKEYKNVVNTEIPKYVNNQLEEALKESYDLIIIDRSLFDRCIWIDRLQLKNGITKQEVESYYKKYIPIIKEKIDLVVATHCDSFTVMKRDYESNLSLEKRSFLSEENVNEYNQSLKNSINMLDEYCYEVKLFETTNSTLKETEYKTINYILDKFYEKSIAKLKEMK